MVDRNVLMSRVARIRESVARLVRLAALSEREFRADSDACALAERHLQVAIQAVIDIGNHVVADLELGAPSEYREVFGLLAQHKLIPRTLATRLAKMAGLRNLLVHDYLRVDPSLVHRMLRRELGDFERFVAAVLKSL